MNQELFLTGRTALITGAGRGIGLSIAWQLAELGARVILVGRTADRLLTLESELQKAGYDALAMPVNVCDQQWLSELKTDQYAVDILVHAAAGFAPYGLLEQRTTEEITEVINTNLMAALQLSAALLPGMKKRGYGMLLFMGSKVASMGAMYQVAYATAKAGLSGLVKSLVVENAFSGINAHLLELGLIDTERTREAMSPNAREKLCARIPAGRPGLPQEVADAVQFLLSPQATYLRGITLPVDGGVGLGSFLPSPPKSSS